MRTEIFAMKNRFFPLFLVLVFLFSFTGCNGFWEAVGTGNSMVDISNQLTSGWIITSVTLKPSDTLTFYEPYQACEIATGESCVFENVPAGEYTVKFTAKTTGFGPETEYIANGGRLLKVDYGVDSIYKISNASVQKTLLNITNETGYKITGLEYTTDKDNWELAAKKTVTILAGRTSEISIPEGAYYFRFAYSISPSQDNYTEEYDGVCVSLDGKVTITKDETACITVYKAENSLF